MKIFLDTNVLVAACIVQHEHYSRALPLVESVHAGSNEGFVSAHGLLEVYAVLTRLPRSPRIQPTQAAALIHENFEKHFIVIALTSREYLQLISRLGNTSVVGGQIYDSLHLQCAEKAQAERIFTFNDSHFKNLAPHLSARIVVP